MILESNTFEQKNFVEETHRIKVLLGRPLLRSVDVSIDRKISISYHHMNRDIEKTPAFHQRK